MPKTILVVDDEKILRWSLSEAFKDEGYTVETAATGKEGMAKFKKLEPDLALFDIRLPDMSGLDMLKKLKPKELDIPVIMITAYGDTSTVVLAMKLGAYDYINKPFDIAELKHTIRKAMETHELKEEVSRTRQQAKSQFETGFVMGSSKKMKALYEMAETIARSEAPTILIQGETGTGKELLARTIFYKSRRSSKPFMEVNCAAIPETLLESELFGYEEGAFTGAHKLKKGLFEMAHGGFLFLDEVGEMPLTAQVKLLRFLENKTFKRVGGTQDVKVDVRIIAATNKDLEEAVHDRKFREDLYYRLKVIPLHIPPLRERQEDILVLAKHFLKEFNKTFKKKIKAFSKQAENMILAYDWPGNVRELKNVIERGVLLEKKNIMEAEFLPLEPTFLRREDAHHSLEMVEKDHILRVLDTTKFNLTKAAKILGITRSTLRAKIKRNRIKARHRRRSV